MAKHPTSSLPDVEIRILKFLKKHDEPVSPSDILVLPEIGSASTSSERRRALWNLIDEGKVVLTDDRMVRHS